MVGGGSGETKKKNEEAAQKVRREVQAKTKIEEMAKKVKRTPTHACAPSRLLCSSTSSCLFV